MKKQSLITLITKKWILALIAIGIQSVLFIVVPVFSILFFPELKIQQKLESAPLVVSYQVQPVKPQEVQQEIKKITTSQVKNSARPNRNSTFSMSLNLASGASSSKSGVAIGGGPAGLTGIYFEASDVDEEATALNEVQPRYPLRAEREGVAGKVSLLLKINHRGRVIQVKVQSASPAGFGFEKAAMEAIKKTKFSPAKKDGVPVSQKRIKEFVFDY
jgi:protein TonB